MKPSPNSSLALNALVLLPLALAAGWLGSLLAQPAGLPSAPQSAASRDPDAATKDRLDEFDRRIDNVDRKASDADETARAALDTVARLESRVEALERRPAAGPGTGPATGVGESGTDGKEIEVGVKVVERTLEEQAREQYVRTQRGFLDYEIGLYGDATEEGEAKRKSQAYADGQRMAVQLGLKDNKADRLKHVYLDHMTRAVQELGPYVRSGLAEADLGTVRDIYRGLWDETDRKVMGLLDGETAQRYREEEMSRRKLVDTFLSEMAKAR